MKEKKLYSIGQISELCNVSTEQLRHYDRRGILSPGERGASNGYRYYTEEQVDDLMLIKELKRAGLPLKEISALVRDKNLKAIKDVLEDNIVEIRKQLREKQKEYDQLVDVFARLSDAILFLNQPIENGFRIVDIEKRPIIFSRSMCSYDIEFPLSAKYAELLTMIEQEKVKPASGLYLLYHNHFGKQFLGENEFGDLEVFAFVDSLVKNNPRYRMFGGFKAACATHIGHYRHTKKLYEDLVEWSINNGYRISGVSFQELVVNRTITSYEESYITKIYLPLNIDDV